jgi:hypothetical protein
MPEPIQPATAPSYCPAEEGPLPPPLSQGPITTLGLVEAPPSLSELAIDCAAKVDAVAIAMAGATGNMLVVALASLKSGFELAECVDAHEHHANVQATIIECTKKGGTPIGVLENSVSCQGVKR